METDMKTHRLDIHQPSVHGIGFGVFLIPIFVVDNFAFPYECKSIGEITITERYFVRW